MSPTSKSVIHDLLYGAIIEIRAYAGTTVSEDDRRFIQLTSSLIHNWPSKLRDCSDSEDYDALLREIWQKHDRRTDPWMRDRLGLLGVDPDSLG